MAKERKAKEDVYLIDDEDRIGIEFMDREGDTERFSCLKADMEDDEYEKYKEYYSNAARVAKSYGYDRLHTGYLNGKEDGKKEGLIEGIVGSIVTAAVTYAAVKIIGWVKRKKKEK